MTLKELSQLYYLYREIEMDKERLAKMAEEINTEEERMRHMELMAEAPTVARLDGMPKGTGGKNQLGNAAIRILALQEHINRKKSLYSECMAAIQAKQTLCITERNKLERYIAELPDSLLRLIFTYRFVEGMTWAQVSDRIGVRTTENSVRKLCYRYLDEQNIKK